MTLPLNLSYFPGAGEIPVIDTLEVARSRVGDAYIGGIFQLLLYGTITLIIYLGVYSRLGGWVGDNIDLVNTLIIAVALAFNLMALVLVYALL